MAAARPIERVPWDSAALGCEAYELPSAAPEMLALARGPGHYSVRVNPLADKRTLHQRGFYYCDTLIEPFCTAGAFKPQPHPAAGLSRAPGLEPLLALCRGAFRHGRFHRDFRTDRSGGTGAVVDHDRLTECFGELEREDARDHVGLPAGRKGHDQADRSARIILLGEGTARRPDHRDNHG